MSRAKDGERTVLAAVPMPTPHANALFRLARPVHVLCSNLSGKPYKWISLSVFDPKRRGQRDAQRKQNTQVQLDVWRVPLCCYLRGITDLLAKFQQHNNSKLSIESKPSQANDA